MASNVSTRLSIMMFLQFFIWGAWYTTVGQYMSKIGMAESIGWAYTVGPIAAIISPFFLGMVADRFFATERVLGVLHVLGGIAMILAPQMAESSVQNWQQLSQELQASGIDPAVQATEYFINPAHYPFVGILLLHMLCYMPTLGLTNTLAFHNIEDQERQFPVIRVFGTIGWIVAGVIVSKLLGADETALPLQIAGMASIALGIYSFTLPHTPPPSAGEKASIRDILGLDSLALLKSRPFCIFMISSLMICIPLAAYYAFAQLFVNHAGLHNPGFQMTYGQMSEIGFMLVMPLFFKRLGVKWMLAVGMLAWVVRYGLFAAAADAGVFWMILVGIILHGICYDFFFVTGQIYVDKRAPVSLRGQAQGFLVLVTQGIGLGLGAQIMQRLVNRSRADNAAALEEQANQLRAEYTAAAESGSEASGRAWDQASELLLQAHDWHTIWMNCAIASAVILIVFVALFRDDSTEAQDSADAGPQGGQQDGHSGDSERS